MVAIVLLICLTVSPSTCPISAALQPWTRAPAMPHSMMRTPGVLIHVKVSVASGSPW